MASKPPTSTLRPDWRLHRRQQASDQPVLRQSSLPRLRRVLYGDRLRFDIRKRGFCEEAGRTLPLGRNYEGHVDPLRRRPSIVCLLGSLFCRYQATSRRLDGHQLSSAGISQIQLGCRGSVCHLWIKLVPGLVNYKQSIILSFLFPAHNLAAKSQYADMDALKLHKLMGAHFASF